MSPTGSWQPHSPGVRKDDIIPKASVVLCSWVLFMEHLRTLELEKKPCCDTTLKAAVWEALSKIPKSLELLSPTIGHRPELVRHRQRGFNQEENDPYWTCLEPSSSSHSDH
ncbi:hypothetical protein DPEC_G00322480 [Dallia pectoralis]|uniref:Uncharacterized protein n=1 Tax=Dallia pectoralis TaxID=75939 RepID=A0ACC2FAF0_DALPE|nr:hypothetical protein DPEC_G00322480 [Dallia pectoralis]